MPNGSVPGVMTMALTFESAQQRQELERAIRERILQMVEARVRELNVSVKSDRIHVGGQAESHYVKQLVLQAAVEAIGAANKLPIRLSINVKGLTRPLVSDPN